VWSGQRIGEDRLRFFARDTVVAQIGRGFVGVPLEPDIHLRNLIDHDAVANPLVVNDPFAPANSATRRTRSAAHRPRAVRQPPFRASFGRRFERSLTTTGRMSGVRSMDRTILLTVLAGPAFAAGDANGQGGGTGAVWTVPAYAPYVRRVTPYRVEVRAVETLDSPLGPMSASRVAVSGGLAQTLFSETEPRWEVQGQAPAMGVRIEPRSRTP
jgi:hypothetical protein